MQYICIYFKTVYFSLCLTAHYKLSSLLCSNSLAVCDSEMVAGDSGFSVGELSVNCNIQPDEPNVNYTCSVDNADAFDCT